MNRLESAIRIVTDAARVAGTVQDRLDRVREITKDDRSPVTVADFAAQAIVALALAEEDPGARIVGEERADALRDPGHASWLDAVVEAVRAVRPDADEGAVLDAIDRCDHDATDATYWTLDPVDGTKGFLRGQQFAIALARIEDGRVTLGVLGCPSLPADPDAPLDRAARPGVLYAAARGGGTTEIVAGAPPRPVTAARFAEDRPLRVCESVEAAHTKHSDTARIMEALGVRTSPVRLDSQCKYAVVARGQADAYLRLPTRKGYVEKVWDHAAGSLVATEAGAVVSDASGAPLDFTHGARLEANRGVICAVREVHERAIAAIERLGIAAPA